jgi:tetratricopeptide (TPR) repeat protein
MARPPVSGSRLAAVLITAVAVATFTVVLATRGGDAAAPAATSAAPADPLPGSPPIALPAIADVPATSTATAIAARVAKDPGRPDLQLALGAARLAAGDAAGADVAFRAAAALGSDEARVARAVAAYDPTRPDDTIGLLATLSATPALQSFAQYQIGVVQVWAGRRPAAVETLEHVRDAAPESFYGVKADDLLHPDYRPGYPFFLPSPTAPDGATLASLAAAAAARPGDVDAQLQLGSMYLLDGRRADALKAFQKGFAASPESVAAQVALAVGSFSKDSPAVSVGKIGPLVRDNPDDPLPRFHLALLLYWIGLKEKGRAEMSQVLAEQPDSVYGRFAAAFVAQSG